MLRKNGVWRRNRKHTILWQQQQQQDPRIVNQATIDTPTTSDEMAVTTEPKTIDTNTGSDKSVVLIAALGLLSTGIIAAITGILPGYYSPDHSTFQTTMLLRDVGSTLLTGILGYAFVQAVTYTTVTKQWIQSRDARKIIHTCSAPLFILFWPLFTTHHPSSRIFAAMVPILNGLRLYIAANSPNANNNNNNNTASSSSESALAQAVSRSGDSKEALGGPFIYVMMLAMSIMCFWTDAPHGIVAMSTLAAGDGMADLVGRRYGANTARWPYNTKKSIVGSLAFVVASTITAFTLILWIQYTHSGLLTLSAQYTTSEIAINVALISIVAAIVETIPWLGDDNYTVPISAAIVSLVLFS